MNLKPTMILAIVVLFTQSLISQNNTLKDFKFPAFIGYVNDFEGLFSDEQIAELNTILSEEEKKTSNEIVIVSIKSFAPYETLFNYSLDLSNYWGVGKKEKNNGIIIVFGKQIRQIRIQVGYGLENKLMDEEAMNIIDNIIIPEFKNGDFYNGIKKGLIEIIKEIE